MYLILLIFLLLTSFKILPSTLDPRLSTLDPRHVTLDPRHVTLDPQQKPRLVREYTSNCLGLFKYCLHSEIIPANMAT